MKPVKKTYRLLPKDDRKIVRSKFGEAYTHLYHATPTRNLKSICVHGLDPKFEGEDSKYADRYFEPAYAMRFSTKKEIVAAISAAVARGGKEADGSIALLRVRSGKLLKLSFGLDHSHSVVMHAVDELMQGSERPLTADEFISLVDRIGILSCYEVIASDQLEVSFDLSGEGKFENLNEYCAQLS